jgi:hypothetical protein
VNHHGKDDPEFLKLVRTERARMIDRAGSNPSGAITMKGTTSILAAAAFFEACSVYADYSVWDKGMWPESWPRELEPLRTQYPPDDLFYFFSCNIFTIIS